MNAAERLLDALDHARSIPPLTDAEPTLDDERAYAIAREIHDRRVARGEHPIGRKIGFTNRNIWPEYGVYQPIWAAGDRAALRAQAGGDARPRGHSRVDRLDRARLRDRAVGVPGVEVPRAAKLAGFRIALLRGGAVQAEGGGANVLDSPLLAFAHLADLLLRQPGFAPVQAGEIVTTGTLTAALPVKPGETWSTRLDGLELPGLSITLT